MARDEAFVFKPLPMTATPQILDTLAALFSAAAPLSWRLLTPYRQGPWGCDALNAALFLRRDVTMAVPIVLKANSRQLQLYNGDMGFLLPGMREAHFPDKNFSLPTSLLPPYEYGYCLSIHKSQGSEADAVLVLIPPAEGSMLLSREMLYTAVTRARRHLEIWSSPSALSAAIGQPSRRHSNLTNRLLYG